MGRTRNGAGYLERAERWSELERDPADIARDEGVSRKTVANAIRVARYLHQGLKERVRSNELAFGKAVVLAKLTKSEQESHVAHESSASGSIVMRLTQMRELAKAVEASTKSDEWKSGALDVLRCVLDEGTISGVWPPMVSHSPSAGMTGRTERSKRHRGPQ